MPEASDTTWWDFAIDPDARADSTEARLVDDDKLPLVNPPGDDGRLQLDYSSYLGLETLLSSQHPASRVPEERMFVIIHQLFELVFKQMGFDLAVIARTFEALLDERDERFRTRVLEPLPDERGPDPFWRPAMTAAARLRHSARRVLPAIMSYVGHGEDDDVLFSTLEYRLFRDFLIPASGFQTAQFRLIQRGLGKSRLLELRVFPGDSYGHHYSGCPTGHVALGDPLILRGGHEAAFPPPHHPASIIAELDDLAHRVLERVGHTRGSASDPPSIRTIRDEEVERAAVRVRATLGERTDADDVVAAFRDDLSTVAADENERRAGLAEARIGAQALQMRHPHTCLTFVLDRLVATDLALHGSDPDSFLTAHRKAVRRHVADESGTGGGGMPYLVTSQRFLLPLFPALVAYSDLGLATIDEDRDRW